MKILKLQPLATFAKKVVRKILGSKHLFSVSILNTKNTHKTMIISFL